MTDLYIFYLILNIDWSTEILFDLLCKKIDLYLFKRKKKILFLVLYLLAKSHKELMSRHICMKCNLNEFYFPLRTNTLFMENEKQSISHESIYFVKMEKKTENKNVNVYLFL